MDYGNVTCDRYYSRFNRTRVFELGGDPKGSGYEGIPENLLVNVVGWIVLLAVFAVLRKIAWDYGRLALISRKEQRWTTFFYGGLDTATADSTESTDTNAKGSQISLDSQMHRHDTALNWIIAIFKLRDEHYRKKNGDDVVQYLRFQRYLLLYMSIITVVSIVVILPVNLTGTNETDRMFGRSTISNLRTDSPSLWTHTILAFSYLALAVFMMRRFSSRVLQDSRDRDVSRTLMISRFPCSSSKEATISTHFREAYPDVAVVNVTFAYHVKKLMQLDTRRKRAEEGRLCAEAVKNKDGTTPTMVPYYCGRLCCCCKRCGILEVEAVQYYTDQEQRLQQAFEQEHQKVLKHGTIGIAFVTFQHEDMAQRVFLDYQFRSCRRSQPKTSSVSNDLHLHQWIVEYAQHPDNVIWENLSSTSYWWWLKAVIINGAVVVALFFLTTPSVLLNTIDDGKDASTNSTTAASSGSQHHNAFFVQFLPTVLLWFFSCLLPWVVYYSDQFIGHWTRTMEHHAVMTKSFVFLLLMVIILPSLGLSSIRAFIEFAFSGHSWTGFRWRCIFQPDNGAFFVNYMITTAFIGNALQLLRFPELVMYAARLLASRSMSEIAAVRRANLWEFQFGQEYAWLLCMFAVSLVYSVSCPLITPFGLLYIGGKHLVDRYNLYFAFKPSKIDRHIHTSAINYVIVAAIVLQFNMLFFNILQTKWDRGLPVFSGIIVVLSMLFFTGRLLFGWFRNLVPSKYKLFENRDAESRRIVLAEMPVFLPNVLLPVQVTAAELSSFEREVKVEKLPEMASSSSASSDISAALEGVLNISDDIRQRDDYTYQ